MSCATLTNNKPTAKGVITHHLCMIAAFPFLWHIEFGRHVKLWTKCMVYVSSLKEF